MAQQLLCDLELTPHTSQQSGVGVPESMPSESLLNSDTLRYRMYLLRKIAWPQYGHRPRQVCQNQSLGASLTVPPLGSINSP